jgi:hypothetical protein
MVVLIVCQGLNFNLKKVCECHPPGKLHNHVGRANEADVQLEAGRSRCPRPPRLRPSRWWRGQPPPAATNVDVVVFDVIGCKNAFSCLTNPRC